MTQMFGYKFFITPEQLIYQSDTLNNIYTGIIHICLGLDFPPEAHSATRILVHVVDVEDFEETVWSGRQWRVLYWGSLHCGQPKRTLTLLNMPNKGQGNLCVPPSILTQTKQLPQVSYLWLLPTCWEPRWGHSGPEKALRQRQGFCTPGMGGTWRDLGSLCSISDQKKAKVFCKGPKSKHSRLCRPLQFCCSRSTGQL